MRMDRGERYLYFDLRRRCTLGKGGLCPYYSTINARTRNDAAIRAACPCTYCYSRRIIFHSTLGSFFSFPILLVQRVGAATKHAHFCGLQPCRHSLFSGRDPGVSRYRGSTPHIEKGACEFEKPDFI